MEGLKSVRRALRGARDRLVAKVRPLLMSKEEREWLDGVVKFFLDEMRAEVECNGIDEWHCYNRARLFLHESWVNAEQLTKLIFDPLDGHCGGMYDDYYGLFKSPGDGCTPLAVFKERVECKYNGNGKLVGAKLYFELVEKNY